MKKAFDGFEKDLIVTSVSPWLEERAKQSPILQNKNHCVVFNGLDTDVFHPYDTEDLRKRHHCEGKKVVFHATPAFSADPNHLKGGYYVLELAKRMSKVQFIVAGPYVQGIEVPENVTLLGRVEDQIKLAKLYSMADVTLLTSKRETFSMVTAESLCCGTPVVGFKAGGPEGIAIPEYSRFVEYADVDNLLNVLRKFMSMGKDKRISNVAKAKYANTKSVQNYLDCYGILIKRWGEEK